MLVDCIVPCTEVTGVSEVIVAANLCKIHCAMPSTQRSTQLTLHVLPSVTSGLEEMHV